MAARGDTRRHTGTVPLHPPRMHPPSHRSPQALPPPLRPLARRGYIGTTTYGDTLTSVPHVELPPRSTVTPAVPGFWAAESNFAQHAVPDISRESKPVPVFIAGEAIMTATLRRLGG